MSDDWTELAGDDIPYHLREQAPPLGQCNRCGRKTWSQNQVGTKDLMPQPDGNPCGGQIIAKGEPGLYGDWMPAIGGR